MDRELSTEILIDYHFGTLAPAERARVEEALLASPESLRAYLRCKRELDRGLQAAGADEVPSPEARLKLRAAVADLVRPRPARRFWGVLARPVPLYQTVAAAAVAALVVAAAGVNWPAEDDAASVPVAGAASAPRVDFARPDPQALSVF